MKLKAKLEILSGPDKGSTYPLEGKVVHIGRAGDNDIILEDNLISRHHAHITEEKGAYFLIDLDTVNGCIVNNQRIHNQRLQNGDMIRLGTQLYRFIRVDEASQQVVTSSEPGRIPQRESISAIEPTAKHRPSAFRMALYGIGMLVIMLVIGVMMLPSPDTSQRDIATAKRAHKNADDSILKNLPAIEKESYYINKEKADLFYASGYRELIANNYYRALDDFKTALELFPDHRLALIYVQRTEETISAEVDKHYKAGINYFNSGQYHLSVFHFRTVVRLLTRRRPAAEYCKSRLERQMELENPDFQKYCDAKQKIEEAQRNISTR